MTNLNKDWKDGGWNLSGSQPQSGDLGQSRSLFLGEALQVHQQLGHLLLVHFLKVLVPVIIKNE